MHITKDSHLDHGLTAGHIAFILKRYADDISTPFKVETFELPDELPPLKSALYGPLAGDMPVAESDVCYYRRGDRAGKSRIVSLPPRSTRTMTVIFGMHEGTCILFTAYGGPFAPREPFDPSLDDDGRANSKLFWAHHALASLD